MSKLSSILSELYTHVVTIFSDTNSKFSDKGVWATGNSKTNNLEYFFIKLASLGNAWAALGMRTSVCFIICSGS